MTGPFRFFYGRVIYLGLALTVWGGVVRLLYWYLFAEEYELFNFAESEVGRNYLTAIEDHLFIW